MKDSDFDNNIDTSNTVDGKPIYYIKHASNRVYGSSTNAGTFYCIWCNNVTVEDRSLTKNGHGVFFWRTNNSKIKNITANSNNEEGIYLYYSSNNIIANNTASNNNCGISIDNSNNNSIENNTITNNGYGIRLWDSNYNIIRENEVDNNSGNGVAIVEGSYNTIFGNNITGNGLGLECYIVNSGYSNKCNYNNFIDSKFMHIIVVSPFPSLRKNNFDSNYWDNWPGVIPKPILGTRRPYQRMLTIVAFDWCPLIYPYNG